MKSTLPGVCPELGTGLGGPDGGWNEIGDAGAIALGTSPHLGSLTRLSLFINDIGPEGAPTGKVLGEPDGALTGSLYFRVETTG